MPDTGRVHHTLCVNLWSPPPLTIHRLAPVDSFILTPLSSFSLSASLLAAIAFSKTDYLTGIGEHISLVPSVISTPTALIPFLERTARIPELRRENADSSVFHAHSLAVAKKTYLSAARQDLTGRIAVIRSFSSNGKRLTMGRPRAARLASGKLQTF